MFFTFPGFSSSYPKTSPSSRNANTEDETDDDVVTALILPSPLKYLPTSAPFPPTFTKLLLVARFLLFVLENVSSIVTNSPVDSYTSIAGPLLSSEYLAPITSFNENDFVVSSSSSSFFNDHRTFPDRSNNHRALFPTSAAFEEEEEEEPPRKL